MTKEKFGKTLVVKSREPPHIYINSQNEPTTNTKETTMANFGDLWNSNFFPILSICWSIRVIRFSNNLVSLLSLSMWIMFPLAKASRPL